MRALGDTYFLLTPLWNLTPDRVGIEGILIRVKAAKRRIAGGGRVFLTCVHGSIVLVSESKASTGLAFTAAFGTLSTNRLLLVTLEFPLTASQAVWTLGNS